MSDQYEWRYLQTLDPFIMDDCRQIKNAPNYNKWLYELVRPFIRNCVLEIGLALGPQIKYNS
jgi:hypothetical protein